ILYVLHKRKGAASGAAPEFARNLRICSPLSSDSMAPRRPDMTTPTELLKKLQVKAGAKLWLINVPRPLAEELSAGAEVEIVHEGDPHDGVLAFFDSPEAVSAIGERLLTDLPEEGLLWVAYRKGPAGRAAGLTRDAGWTPLTDAGWRPVRQVAIGEEWSGLRFRPRHKVAA